MKTEELLSKIVSEFIKVGFAQVPGYNRFGYIRTTENAVYVTRETGKDTRIPFDKIVTGIEAVKKEHGVYDSGPGSLREYGITHVNSPIWALLHMIPKSDYK